MHEGEQIILLRREDVIGAIVAAAAARGIYLSVYSRSATAAPRMRRAVDQLLHAADSSDPEGATRALRRLPSALRAEIGGLRQSSAGEPVFASARFSQPSATSTSTSTTTAEGASARSPVTSPARGGDAPAAGAGLSRVSQAASLASSNASDAASPSRTPGPLDSPRGTRVAGEASKARI